MRRSCFTISGSSGIGKGDACCTAASTLAFKSVSLLFATTDITFPFASSEILTVIDFPREARGTSHALLILLLKAALVESAIRCAAALSFVDF